MNEEEQAALQKCKTINTMTTLAMTGLIPFTLIFMLSIKYNPPLYTKLMTRTLVLGAVNAFIFTSNNSLMHIELNEASKKYFTNLSDNEILDYDNRMKL